MNKVSSLKEKNKVPPGFEPGSFGSEPNMITTTLRNRSHAKPRIKEYFIIKDNLHLFIFCAVLYTEFRFTS